VLTAKARLVQWCGEQANAWENAINPVRRRQWAESLAAELVAEGDGSATLSVKEIEARLLPLALDWFEAERQTLIQAFDWADETQQRQESVALAANLAPFLSLRGYWVDLVATHQKALRAAQEAGDAPGEGQTLNNLGNVYQAQGKWTEAIACYEQSLEICRRIGDVHGEGQSIMGLGNVYQAQGKWTEAIACYEQSLEIKRRIGDVHGEGQTLANWGRVYALQKQQDQAIALWQDALTKLHPESPDYTTVSQWIESANQPRRPQWLGWLLPLAILLFLGWNLLKGHWWIALLTILFLLIWQWFRRRR
jgi:tetratricopeptide (TPR) repeat protein